MNNFLSWFNNRKVGSKVTLILGSIIVLLVVLSLGTIFSMRILSKNTEEIFEKNLKPIATLGLIRQNIPYTRVLLRDMIIFTDNSIVQARLAEMQNSIKETNTNIALYQSLISSPEERAAFEDFQQKLKIFREARQTIINLVLQERRQEAILLLESQCIPKSRDVLSALQKIVDINFQQAEAFAQKSRQSSFIATLCIVFACFVCILTAFIGRYVLQHSITKRLGLLTQKAQLVEQGNLDQTIDVHAEDELGKLASSFAGMVKSIKLGIDNLHAEKSSVEAKVVQAVEKSEQERRYLQTSSEKLLAVLEEFADGDLRVRVSEEKSAIKHDNDNMEKIFHGFNHSVEAVENLVCEVVTNVDQTTVVSTHIGLATRQIAATSQEQAAQITQIASSIEEMARSITENAHHAAQVDSLTREAGESAMQGAQVVQSAVSKIQEIATVVSDAAITVEKLGNSSAEIGEIVQVIEEIADQTNLLALNAAIEAARAGEQGRGFAVVADEVRKLAERTATATKQISQTIKQIQKDTGLAVNGMKRGDSEVKQGLTLAEQAGEALVKIVDSTSEVQSMVRASAQAMEQQSSTAEEVAKSIEQMSASVEQTTASLSEIAHSTDKLQNSVDDVQNLLTKFKVNSSPTGLPSHHSSSFQERRLLH